MSHQKNLEICEAASDGPLQWDDYVMTFDPPTVRAYIEKAIEHDELRIRCHDLANQVMVRDGQIMELGQQNAELMAHVERLREQANP